jgi:hypothetical protein
MIRRHPLTSGFAGLLALCVVYAFAKDPVYDTLRETWHRQVDVKLVENRSRLETGTGILLGMYRPELPWDFDGFFRLGAELGATPRIVSWYQAWGDRKDNEFKEDALDACQRAGLVPLITWEPWVTGFAAYREQNPDSSLMLVIQGRFDAYIHTWAHKAVRHHHPFFLRPLHEPGNPWYSWSTAHGNSPVLIRQAWQHIVAIFRDEGADNVAFVWTPYTLADTAAWPGSEYVDWIGLDVFNYGTRVEHGNWRDFEDLVRAERDPLRHFGKPIMLCEVGTTDGGGDPADWWARAFKDMSSPALADIRGLVVFNNPVGITPMGTPVDWTLPDAAADFQRYRPQTRRLKFR